MYVHYVPDTDISESDTPSIVKVCTPHKFFTTSYTTKYTTTAIDRTVLQGHLVNTERGVGISQVNMS